MKHYQLYTDTQIVAVTDTLTGDLQFFVDNNRTTQWSFVQAVLNINYEKLETDIIRLLDSISYGKQKDGFQKLLIERNSSCLYSYSTGDFPIRTVRSQLNIAKGSKYGDCM